MPLKYGIGKRIANAATKTRGGMGFEWKLGKKSSETPIRLCSFNTLWGCGVARAFTSNTFAVVFSWGKTWDFFLSTRVESSNVDSWNPFLKNAIRISNFCICACSFETFFSLSPSFSLVIRAKRKMFYEMGIFLKRIRIFGVSNGRRNNGKLARTLRESRFFSMSDFQFLSYFFLFHCDKVF